MLRKRLSFIGKKKRRSSSGNSEEIKYIPAPIPDLIKLYDNSNSGEKIILLKNNSEFSLIGKGTLRLIHGSIYVFGYNINSDNDVNEYDFNTNNTHHHYSCVNSGIFITNESQYDGLITKIEKFIGNQECLKNMKNFKSISFNYTRDRISVVYFKNIESDFKIMKRLEIKKSEYIDCSRYDQSVTQDIIENNKTFLICGKKNSGKSTFLQYLINNILSFIKNKSCKLFLLDCDSGQPLLSYPYNVSLVKIHRPLFINHFNACDTSISETVTSVFVEENSPYNRLDEYLQSVESINSILSSIPGVSNDYVIINTNGYTHGLGDVSNSAIVKLLKPDLTFYVKNLSAGREERGKEFENFILKEIHSDNMEIILRQYKTHKTITNLELKSIVIENDFKLEEIKNFERKNKNKSEYIIHNLVGTTEQYNIGDIINNRTIAEQFLTEISFENIIFSFNYSVFKPKNELDQFLAVNGKICFVLKQTNDITEKTVDFNKIKIQNRRFHCFAYVYNIDIIKQKIYLISNKLKSDEKIILYRTNNAIDQYTSKDKTLDKRLVSMRFNNIFSDSQTQACQTNSLYMTRNKFSLI